MRDEDARWRSLCDRAEIGDCLARLARGEDRRDAVAIRGCFWPDATTDYGIFAGDFDAYLAWVVPGSDAISMTQHILGQSLIVFDGADGARVETHVSACHRIEGGDGARDLWLGGRYLDAMARREGAWRIAARTMLTDWVRDAGPAADWAQGLMGAPFTAPHYSGRAQGDFSEAFFAIDDRA